MNELTRDCGGSGFVFGLLTGTFVGAGLALWFAPRAAAELRQRAAHSAMRLGKRASKHYQEASTAVVDAVDDRARRGRDARDDVADAVAHGAHEVERYAAEAKTDGA